MKEGELIGGPHDGKVVPSTTDTISFPRVRLIDQPGQMIDIEYDHYRRKVRAAPCGEWINVYVYEEG